MFDLTIFKFLFSKAPTVLLFFPWKESTIRTRLLRARRRRSKPKNPKERQKFSESDKVLALKQGSESYIN